MNFRTTGCTAVFLIVLFVSFSVSFSALAQLPDDWDTDICDGAYYGDGECDCGCGDFDDLDCLSMSAPDCAYYMCDDGEYPAYFNNAVCLAVGMDTDLPFGWSCPSFVYDDDMGCECGCGAVDGDCEDATVHSCDYNECYDEEDTSADPFYPGYSDNAQCYAPGDDPDITGWICLPEWWRDGFCDCGCGIIDYDCDDETVAACDEIFCGDDETVINSDIATCVPIGTVDTATDPPPDTDPPVDTGIDTNNPDTATGSDTVEISDTGSESETATEADAHGSDTDSDTNSDAGSDAETDTADSETVADSATVADGPDTATADTETESEDDTGADTALVTDPDTNGLPNADTEAAESVDTTEVNDSSTSSETGANATITGRPQESDSGGGKGGGLFGCIFTPGTTGASLLRLFF